MQITVGALSVLLVLAAQPAGVSALGLRKEHHVPVVDGFVSLMQGKVDLLKANNTESAIPPVKHHPSPVNGAGAASAILGKTTTGNVWNTKLGKEEKAVLVIWATALLMGLAVCLALGAVALLLCCLYDAVCRGLHWARFRQCQAKVQRAHEAFASKSGVLSLCPYCVEHISVKRSPNKVVFLCGHRFHVECSNRWFSEHPNQTAHCPICRDVEPILDMCKGRCAHGCESHKEPESKAEVSKEAPDQNNADKDADPAQSRDGALAFILQSLHRCYPEIINEECVERWMTCNTEIWLSELKYPRYNSILRKNK